MKKFIFSILSVGLLVSAAPAFAQMGMMGGYYGTTSSNSSQSSEIKSVLDRISSTQGVESSSEIDCSQVTDEQFEQLGDAYMDVMLPNEQQHEAMDNMMGGEGSESLTQAHINMGRSYLGCWSDYSSGPIHASLMGGGMMGGYNSYYPASFSTSGMMGSWGYGTWYGIGHWVTMILVWVLLILGIVAAWKYVNKSKK